MDPWVRKVLGEAAETLRLRQGLNFLSMRRQNVATFKTGIPGMQFKRV
jgi:hypothetical protein